MSPSKGFTLTELTMALAIMALLIAGAMIPLTAQIEVRNVADTQRTMESIRDAIIGFAQATGRLPCPADGSIPAGTTNAGLERKGFSSCNVVGSSFAFDALPWATLGVPETDAWGRRFSYRVSPAFADTIETSPGIPLKTWNTRLNNYTTPPAGNLTQIASTPSSPANQTPVCDLTSAPTLSSFALCTLGDIAVFTRGGSTTAPVPLAPAIPAVIISHGKNGLGAWQTNGIRLTPIPSGNDEAVNVNGTTQLTPTGGYMSRVFFSRTPTPAASGCVDPIPPATSSAPLCEFDDIVVVISSNTLVARMVAAGRLP